MGICKKGRRYRCPKCGAIFKKEPGKGRVVCPNKKCGSSRCFRISIGGEIHSLTRRRLRYIEKHPKKTQGDESG